MNSQLCLIMILNGFNISCRLGKYSNNVFYGFSSTPGILPVSQHEQKEVDDFFKSTSRLKSTALLTFLGLERGSCIAVYGGLKSFQSFLLLDENVLNVCIWQI